MGEAEGWVCLAVEKGVGGVVGVLLFLWWLLFWCVFGWLGVRVGFLGFLALVVFVFVVVLFVLWGVGWCFCVVGVWGCDFCWVVCGGGFCCGFCVWLAGGWVFWFWGWGLGFLLFS
ncbi:hypothetical protein [Pseudomonas syringae group genomosp. 7]|uniref:hypothetical protein n=1 Tax=Pseudomonas syringae group genomosp. 7 TaxID=251699 RepID=UPI00376FC3D5